MSSMRDSHVQHGRHICCRGWHVSEHERHIRDLHTGWRLVLYRVADRLAWRHVLETCSVDEELHELALDTARGASDGQVLWGCSSCCSPLGLLLMLGPVRHLCYSIHACTHTHTHTHTHTLQPLAARPPVGACPFVCKLCRAHTHEMVEGLMNGLRGLGFITFATRSRSSSSCRSCSCLCCVCACVRRVSVSLCALGWAGVIVCVYCSASSTYACMHTSMKT